MAKILCLASRKGGVGKTYLVRSLSVAGLYAAVKTGIVDADPQESAVKWSKRREAGLPIVQPLGKRSIREQIDTLRQQGAGLIIIDTPPHSTLVASAAIRESDYVLIPTEAGPEAIEAIADTVAMVREAGKAGGIVLNRVPGGVAGATLAKALHTPLSGYGLPLAPVHLVGRIGGVHASAMGLTASEEDPRSDAAAEVTRLWNWVAREMGLPLLPEPEAKGKRKQKQEA